MMWDLIKFIVLMLSITMLLFIAVVYLAFAMNDYDCSRYAEITGRNTKTSFGTCYVEIVGKGYVPREELNLRAITNE